MATGYELTQYHMFLIARPVGDAAGTVAIMDDLFGELERAEKARDYSARRLAESIAKGYLPSLIEDDVRQVQVQNVAALAAERALGSAHDLIQVLNVGHDTVTDAVADMVRVYNEGRRVAAGRAGGRQMTDQDRQDIERRLDELLELTRAYGPLNRWTVACRLRLIERIAQLGETQFDKGQQSTLPL